jgi:hypothetical protein
MADLNFKEVSQGAAKAFKKHPAIWGIGGLGAVLLALYMGNKSSGSEGYSVASYVPSDTPSGSGSVSSGTDYKHI